MYGRSGTYVLAFCAVYVSFILHDLQRNQRLRRHQHQSAESAGRMATAFVPAAAWEMRSTYEW